MDPTRIRELLSGLSCPLCGGTRGDTLLIVIDAPHSGGGSVRVQCVRCHLFWSFAVETFEPVGALMPEPLEPPEPEPQRPPITVDDGLNAVRMIMAAYRAAATGRRQALLP